MVMSTKKVVLHPLNARGLQAFRALLAIRAMADAVRDSAPPGARGQARRRTLLRDGVVAEAYDPPGGRLLLPAAIAAKFEALFRRNSRRRRTGGWDARRPRRTTSRACTSTHLPTYKAWIFLNVTVVGSAPRLCSRPQACVRPLAAGGSSSGRGISRRRGPWLGASPPGV